MKKPSSLWLICYLALENRYSKKSVTPKSLDVTPEGTQNHRGCCRHVQGPAMCFRKRTLATVQGGAPLYPKWSQRVCQDNKQVCKIKLQFRNKATLEQQELPGCQPSWQSKSSYNFLLSPPIHGSALEDHVILWLCFKKSVDKWTHSIQTHLDGGIHLVALSRAPPPSSSHLHLPLCPVQTPSLSSGCQDVGKAEKPWHRANQEPGTVGGVESQELTDSGRS